MGVLSNCIDYAPMTRQIPTTNSIEKHWRLGQTLKKLPNRHSINHGFENEDEFVTGSFQQNHLRESTGIHDYLGVAHSISRSFYNRLRNLTESVSALARKL